MRGAFAELDRSGTTVSGSSGCSCSCGSSGLLPPPLSTRGTATGGAGVANGTPRGSLTARAGGDTVVCEALSPAAVARNGFGVTMRITTVGLAGVCWPVLPEPVSP